MIHIFGYFDLTLTQIHISHSSSAISLVHPFHSSKVLKHMIPVACVKFTVCCIHIICISISFYDHICLKTSQVVSETKEPQLYTLKIPKIFCIDSHAPPPSPQLPNAPDRPFVTVCRLSTQGALLTSKLHFYAFAGEQFFTAGFANFGHPSLQVDPLAEKALKLITAEPQTAWAK